MYGEPSEGKVYKQGVKLPCIVDQKILISIMMTLGWTINKMYLSIPKKYLVEVDLKPDIGDILKWNEGYFFEVDSYNENQLIGGDPTKSHSIVVKAFNKNATTNLEEYRGF